MCLQSALVCGVEDLNMFIKISRPHQIGRRIVFSQYIHQIEANHSPKTKFVTAHHLLVETCYNTFKKWLQQSRVKGHLTSFYIYYMISCYTKINEIQFFKKINK